MGQNTEYHRNLDVLHMNESEDLSGPTSAIFEVYNIKFIIILKCSYVPPQNSMEVSEPAGLLGSASSSSTGTPIDTTLTGSGYVSSNTARRPCMALAAARGASRA